MAHEDLTDDERDALHEFQLAAEYLHRAYGDLLECHHEVGHAMDRMADAEELLRDAGHDEMADELRHEHLPAGAIEDKWTYEIVEEFRDGFFADLTDYEAAVREELVDGERHVSEKRQRDQLRERAGGDVDGNAEAGGATDE
jgi:predicted  nucleic acid-binding Zn-ribbon protein